MKKSAAPCFTIAFQTLRATERLARQGSWRMVLADIDRWTEQAAAAQLPLDSTALETIGRAGLCRKGMKIPLGILDRGFFPDVPRAWLKTAAAHAQDETLAELVRRCDGPRLCADMGHLLGSPRDRDALGWAIHHRLESALDAFIAKGCQAPQSLIQFLTCPDEGVAATLVPRLVALGASPCAFPSGYSTYNMRGTFSSSSPETPLEAALTNRLPALALALIEAGADPAAPARTFSSRSEPDTTALHLGVAALMRDTSAPNKAYADRKGETFEGRRARLGETHHRAVVALLQRVAGLPAWWMEDAQGERPATAVKGVKLNARGAEWLKLAEDLAHMVDLPQAAASRHRPRL